MVEIDYANSLDEISLSPEPTNPHDGGNSARGVVARGRYSLSIALRDYITACGHIGLLLNLLWIDVTLARELPT